MPDEIEFRSRKAWRSWLSRHHATASGVWAIYPKKAFATASSPGYDDLVEEALCFGWIDSRPGRVDDERTKLYFSPRKPGSGWAASNKARVERLTVEGLMTPAGLETIARAQADGSWTRIDGSESGAEPADLGACLDANPAARANWNGFPQGARRAILQWIELARTAPTRERRIAEAVAKAARNERANEWRPPTH